MSVQGADGLGVAAIDGERQSLLLGHQLHHVETPIIYGLHTEREREREGERERERERGEQREREQGEHRERSRQTVMAKHKKCKGKEWGKQTETETENVITIPKHPHD